MFAALTAAGGNVRFWEYANYHHNAWDRAYVDPATAAVVSCPPPLGHRHPPTLLREDASSHSSTPIHVDPTVYDAYQGEYVDAGVTQVTIFRQGNKLMSRNRTGDQTELLPEEPNRFFYPSGSSTRITFEKGLDGRVTGLIFSDDRHQEVWEKAPESSAH